MKATIAALGTVVFLVGGIGASASAADLAQVGGRSPRPGNTCSGPSQSDSDCAKQFRDTGWSCNNAHLEKKGNGYCECQCLDEGGAKRIGGGGQGKLRMGDPTNQQQ